MKMIKVAVLGLLMAGATAQANPVFNASQPIAGVTSSRWTFMTAWNLSTSLFQVSPNFFNGRSVWTHSASANNQWIARFVYDQVTGQTRELAWYYSQVHVQ